MKKFLLLVLLLLPPYLFPMNEPSNRLSLEITGGEESSQEIRVDIKRRPHKLERSEGFYLERHAKRKAFIRGVKKIGSLATKVALSIIGAVG